jgi:hypothetical protein
MSEELIADPVHKSHDDEYFDGNDVKSYSAQSRGEHHNEAKTPEEIRREEILNEPAVDYFDKVYKDALKQPGGTEEIARAAEQEARNVRQAMETVIERQAAEARTEKMQDTVESVVARHEAKIDAREDVQEVLETIQDKEPDTDEHGMTEAGYKWLAQNTAPLPGAASQEQSVLPRPAGEGSASEKSAPKLGMFERRRLEASKDLMNKMTYAADELARSSGLTVEEHVKYAEDAKRYRAASADLVMGVRPALSRGELKGNKGSLERLENKVLKNKKARGETLTKEQQKRLKKIT